MGAQTTDSIRFHREAGASNNPGWTREGSGRWPEMWRCCDLGHSGVPGKVVGVKFGAGWGASTGPGARTRCQPLR